MTYTFLHLSDLHFRSDWPEETGVVLSKFFEDIEIQQSKLGPLHLIFSGDLVQSGSDKSQSAAFLSDFASKLNDIGIPIERRVCIPGNHDISREKLRPRIRSIRGSLTALNSEEAFNQELPSLITSHIGEAFENYISAEKEFAGLTCCQTNLGGMGWKLDESTGIYCLNTALCSLGGLPDPDTQKGLDDRGRLHVDTRSINRWMQSTDFKTRIVVMHHPLEWLSEWSKKELERLAADKIDLLCTGHIHSGDAVYSQNAAGAFVNCKAPALFTRKGSNTIGYSIITLDSLVGKIDIKYRQWTGSRFVLGTGISENDEGRICFGMKSGGGTLEVDNASEFNNTETLLESEFHDAAICYSSKTRIWIDRDISDHPETDRKREASDGASITELILVPRSCIIRAPREFGLTCLGRFMALEHFKSQTTKRKVLVHCDASSIGPHKHGVLTEMAKRCGEIHSSLPSIGGIILDNWQFVNNGPKLLRAIREQFPDLPVIILHGISDFKDLHDHTEITSDVDMPSYYLLSLSRVRVRELTGRYLDAANSELDADAVTQKIIEDIDALNTPRTPLSCLMLLKLIERHFDESPVNRTEVIKKVLTLMFYDFDQIPKYSSRPDLTDCETALGYLCEWMLKENRHVFRKEEFFDKIHEFCRHQRIIFDCDVLFSFLCSENILIKKNSEYGFRLAYWRFYFIALRMHHESNFAAWILSDFRYTAFPEVIEFYTGIDRRRKDAVEKLTSDLNGMDAMFLQRTKIGPKFNPLISGMWNPSPVAVVAMESEVIASIQNSALPPEVKNAVADGSYDRSKPYHQDVSEWLKSARTDQMVQAMKAAARALRNSDYVEPAQKLQLLNAVMTAWTRLCQILVVLSPILSTNRSAFFEGVGFYLDHDFAPDTDPRDLWKLIMLLIADNVVDWHHMDLSSKKLGPLFQDYLRENRETIGELLLLIVIIRQRPVGWFECVDSFVTRANKNSLYLNRIYENLMRELKFGFVAEPIRKQLKTLASKAVAKHSTGAKNPNQKLISKVAEQIDNHLSVQDN